MPPTYRERLHQVGGLGGQPLLLFDVVRHVAELLLQHAHRLKVGGVVEGVAAQKQELTAGRRFKENKIDTTRDGKWSYREAFTDSLSGAPSP